MPQIMANSAGKSGQLTNKKSDLNAYEEFRMKFQQQQTQQATAVNFAGGGGAQLKGAPGAFPHPLGPAGGSIESGSFANKNSASAIQPQYLHGQAGKS